MSRAKSFQLVISPNFSAAGILRPVKYRSSILRENLLFSNIRVSAYSITVTEIFGWIPDDDPKICTRDDTSSSLRWTKFEWKETAISAIWWKGSIDRGGNKMRRKISEARVTVLINEITRVRATITSSSSLPNHPPRGSIFPMPFPYDHHGFSDGRRASLWATSTTTYPSYVSTLPATRHDRSASRDERGEGEKERAGTLIRGGGR